jgi:lysine-ketoglutarate reductase/saccharopine dehydrogenase-like protein (TIGR00300 family)
MMKPATYRAPDFNLPLFQSAPDAACAVAQQDGIAPAGYHATSIFPEYFRIGGQWRLIEQSRMDCAVVVREGAPHAVEQRNIRAGDTVVLGREEDGASGIYLHIDAFEEAATTADGFAFRGSRTRETSYSRDYDSLYELLKYEREHGFCVWVLGPACTFDFDSRRAMAALVSRRFVQAIFAGNALATHDIEAAVMKTALGQDIYTQHSVKNGHYHHLDTINMVCECGGIRPFIEQRGITDGIMAAAIRHNIPYVLAGSIRDDGPLPDVVANVYEAQAKMRAILSRATTVIAMATQLHAIATGNMTPSYCVKDGVIRPVNFYAVDISEFAVNKLRDRGSLSAKSIVTNVQDFLVNLERSLDET